MSSSTLRCDFVTSLLPKENGRKLMEKTNRMSSEGVSIILNNLVSRKPKVFALQILQRYLTKEGRVRKFLDCLYG